MTWFQSSAGFTGFGKSKTGISHCRQYILRQPGASDSLKEG